ncbi:MAG: phosphomannomutase/phosphoglucomutase [Eubacteriales bacterium]|nr:phosphomannomutase/phosphoglucomutase [Eubacteriales bacterium]
MGAEWKKLKNGSDFRGVALEGVAGQPVNLTDEAVGAIVDAYVLWLSQRTGKAAADLKIAIGHDPRLSHDRIKTVAMASLMRSGVHAFDCGLASTPAMFMTTKNAATATDGAIEITASHLPFNRNGLKMFTCDGSLEGKDVELILDWAVAGKRVESNTAGSCETIDFMSLYAADLVDQIRRQVNSPEDYDRPLAGSHIIVDAGNGVGGFFVDKVLKPLGADTAGSQFLEPDGHFPNHIPNPEDENAMEAICDAVKKYQADLGLIFDTDVDRAAAVDARGNEINKNDLIALISAILLEKEPGAWIVTDSITSTGLTAFIEERGGVHHRFKRGYKNVINEAVRLNKEGFDCPLAIETSGHAALRENYFLDDGAYLMARLLVKMAQLKREGRTLDAIIADLKHPAEGREFRMNLLLDDFKPYGQRIIDELTAYARTQKGWTIPEKNFEGIRVSFDKENGDGWFLLRLSLHDPLIPLNIESDEVGGVKIIAAKLAAFLTRYDKLDTAELVAFSK